jgi:hypothetical protein
MSAEAWTTISFSAWLTRRGIEHPPADLIEIAMSMRGEPSRFKTQTREKSPRRSAHDADSAGAKGLSSGWVVVRPVGRQRPLEPTAWPGGAP